MQVLNYQEARSHIKDGDIVFMKGERGFVASTIQVFTRSAYTHVGIAFWVKIAGSLRLMIVEAQGGTQRRVLNLSYYRGRELEVISGPKEWSSVSSIALERLGQVPYGWLEAIYVGLRESLLKYFNIALPLVDLPGEICSEYVAKVYELPIQNISPQFLLDYLVEDGHEVRLHVKG